MTRALVISFSDLASDPRVDRQIETLRGGGYEVVAAGLGPPAYTDAEFVDLAMPPRRATGRALGLARLLARRHDAVYWTHPHNRRALELLSGVRADVVVANDMPALPLALALPGAAPVVFDAHEYAPSEQAERRAWRAVMAPYMRTLCRLYLPRVAGMMTVSPGIAELYRREYGVDAAVVTNAPRHDPDLAPSPVGDPIRLLHHGVAQRGRLIERCLDVFELLGPGFAIDLVLAPGDAAYREELAARAETLPGARVLPPHPMRELVRRANAYDIGIYLLAPRSDNYRHALPNKFFEFIQARLAVAIGPLPDMAAIVREWGCGVVADDFESATMATALRALTREDVAALKARAHAAAPELSHDRDREVLLDVVRRALR